MDYVKIDIDALLDIVRCAEEQPDALFDMSDWGTDTGCGTRACLIGTWYIRNPEYCGLTRLHITPECQLWIDLYGEEPKYDFSIKAIAGRLGMPESLVNFLFANHDCGTSSYASDLDKKEAIRRMRKVIYYILHKREMWTDLERARHMGDAGISRKVEQAVTVCEI